jgi:N-acetylmuramoyl-L-alanine amidase
MLSRSEHGSRSSRTLAVLVVLGAAVLAACSSTASSISADSVAHPVARRAARFVSPKRSPLPLGGKVVGIDPGHNGRNYTDPAFINHLIWNGREEEGCDTTGTQTDGGYTEAQYNFNVATYLAADLRAAGAKVVLTRKSNDGIGPCVNTRSEIINRAHANVAIDIHADGGPPGGRGFAILEPVADGPNDRVIGASKRFGHDLLERFRTVTRMPVSTYDGVGGIVFRDDLAGLNLTTVPKVLIECGNMRNAIDAALLVRASFQKLAAKAMSEAITQYLTAGR